MGELFGILFLTIVAPLWIIALWCHFATTVPTFAPLRSRPVIAFVLGAIGGPLAYAGGMKMGAAAFHPEPWISWLSIAVVWGIALLLMLGPIQTMVSWVPFIGDLTGFLLFVAGFLMAVVVSSTTIALAWFAVRPIMSIGLLILAVAAIVAIRAMRGKKEDRSMALGAT